MTEIVRVLPTVPDATSEAATVAVTAYGAAAADFGSSRTDALGELGPADDRHRALQLQLLVERVAGARTASGSVMSSWGS